MPSVAEPVAIQGRRLAFGRPPLLARPSASERFQPSVRPSPDPVSVVCALIDNCLDARARNVDVRVQSYAGRATSIAVIDDGVGMVPEMIQAACAPGSSCRLGDGPHFARTGSGLPKLPLAIGARFTVFSRVGAGDLHGVMVARPASGGASGPVPAAARVALPLFLAEKVGAALQSHSATVVLIECLSDSFLSARALRRLLRRRLAFAFGRLSARLTIAVEGLPLASDDALGETGPGFYVCGDNDAVTVTSVYRRPSDRTQAKRHDTLPTRALASAPESGIVAVRMGRRLGPVRDNPLWRAASEDRHWRIEIDYPPAFDGDFRPNINLDAVDISDAIWGRLEAEGLLDLVDRLRAVTH